MDECSKILNNCRDGNLTAVENDLLSGISPNIQNFEGDSALQITAANGFVDIAVVLLKNGANVDLPNNYGWTPLMHATRHGHSDVVSLLIQKKAKVNINNRLGLRPIDVAAWSGNVCCVNLLIDAGAIIDNLPSSNTESDICDSSSLMSASLQGHDLALRTLLENGSSINQASPITGLTPLMLAACSGYLHIVEILIEWNVDVNETDKCGRTALDLAVACKKINVVTYLESVTHPTSIKMFDRITYDANILDIIRTGDITKVKSSLQSKPNLCNYLDPSNGITPLMISAMLGYNNIIDVLISNGAYLNAQDLSDGWTPLMYAVFHRQAETVHLLLDKGAKVDICTSNGYTVLDLAIHIDSSETDIVETLSSYFMSEELHETQEYFAASPSSTIRRNYLTVGKVSGRSDSQARLKDWIGGLSTHLRQLSKSSAMSPAVDSQMFDESFTDVFVEDNVSDKTLEGKYLSISKFYAPSQRFAHLLKEQEVEAINLPPLLCHENYIDSIKPISSRKNRPYRNKSIKPFNSLRTPHLLKRFMNKQKQPAEFLNQVPKQTDVFSESLNSEDTCDLTVKTTVEFNTSSISESKVTESEHGKNEVSTKVGSLMSLLNEGSLKRYAEKFRDQEIDLETFQHLTEDDLDEIGIKSMESRNKCMEIIGKLKNC